MLAASKGSPRASLNRPPLVRVQALDRAFRLIDALREGPLPANDLARLTRLPRSTVFRLLRDLEVVGYVVRVRPGTFGLSVKLVELASSVLNQLEVRQVAHDILEAISTHADLTTHLAVRDGLFALCVDRIEATKPIRLAVPIGRRVPLHAGASSKVLLAFAPEAVVEEILRRPLPKLASGTLTNRPRLRAELQRIRRQGFAWSSNEVYQGARGVSAPIRDATGAVVAAMSLGGLTAEIRLTDRSLIQEVLAAAAKISGRLGHRASGAS